MNYDDTQLTLINNSVIWRYFVMNIRLGAAFLFLFYLFFAVIAGMWLGLWFFIFGVFLSTPLIVMIIYYALMLRFLKRSAAAFLFETVTLNEPRRRGKYYAFTVEAADTYGRSLKTTRAIFNNLPNHFMAITNYAHKEVVIAHLEGKKRVYIINVKTRQFYES